MVGKEDNPSDLPKRRYDHSDVPSWVEDTELGLERIHVHEQRGEGAEYSYTIQRFTIKEHDSPRTTVMSDTTIDLEKMR